MHDRQTIDVVVREYSDLLCRSMAVFSPEPTPLYRYALHRQWGADESNVLGLCGMNPSTADERKNDPTLARWQRRAERNGFDGFVVVNAWGLRSTDPMGLLSVDDPVGPHNDAMILEIAKRSRVFVCGWGVPPHKRLVPRVRELRERLTAAGVKLHVLGLTQDGFPRHPLYVGYERKWSEWK